jgi:3-oxoacyl-[acyl-carrier-protein] synthase-3
MKVKIMGMGHYVPSQIVTAAEIEARCGLPANWVAARTGVSERRWATHETNAFMAAEAAREALDEACYKATDIDLILNASGTQAQAVPDGAPFLQKELGLAYSGIACFSIHATCLSFVVGLQTAASLIHSGTYRRILLVSSDISSCGLNFNEAESAALLGDGAAAVVLEATPDGESAGISAFRMETYSIGADLTELRGGGSRKHPNHPETTPEDNLFSMKGIQVLKMAQQYLPNFLELLRPGLSTSMAGVSYIIPHQASRAALLVMGKTGWDMAKVGMTLEKYGNCVSASIPLTLYDAQRKGAFKRGDEILLVGTGAGLSLGGMILQY